MTGFHDPAWVSAEDRAASTRLRRRVWEAYGYRDEGAIYTFSWEVDGESGPSPMNQDPLLLIPSEARERVDRGRDLIVRVG